MAADGPKPGFLGNLNDSQEAKLQKLWSVLLKAAELPNPDELNGNGNAAENATPASPVQPQRRQSLLSRTQSNVSDKPSVSATSPYQQKMLAYLRELGIGPQETKMVQKSLLEITPTELREGILELLKHDHPDGMMLRFLRARKWDIPKAFAMMMEAIVWRVKEMHVEDDVMAKGELHALKQSKDNANAKEKKEGHDLLAQMRMGKSYVHGTDKLGRPIVVVRVRLHKPGAQSEETLERYIVHVIESVRLAMASPVETAAVVFDMTGFGLSNMEYPPVKFILKCFEANYPESLGILLIHNAPWVFSGVWRLIRGWMDPDIAAKVQFTNSVSDMEKFISRDQIVKELGGSEQWEYKYIEPEENENATMQDTTTRDALIRERQQIGEEFMAFTSEWIEAANSQDKAKTQSAASQRTYLAERLRVNYWKLDPYVRARLCLDRMRVIQKDGKVNFYPKEDDIEETKESPKVSEFHHVESINGTATQTPVS
ncbi:hypothetical protein N7509_011528 [Penicillium cosmopolitanum]|uniref:CRAL-TRIO domain-containing protein n=1 Tax=Penicillium cosmopolitanum TaxID=1131564 RepID=A0A9W9SJG1_9EURO|nr:uncharacterized protein N7509_011528 [Penicillium cosmopolitanum]KAJ5378409.1 hypothetical protein N7509_011528 [Penicillium cosmopolitanum]